MNQVERNFRKAARLIRRNGWCQHGIGRDGKRRCIEMAIRDVAGIKDLFFNTTYCTILEEVTGMYVFKFNDEQCKNEDDAVAVLEIAADLAA